MSWVVTYADDENTRNVNLAKQMLQNCTSNQNYLDLK